MLNKIEKPIAAKVSKKFMVREVMNISYGAFGNISVARHGEIDVTASDAFGFR